MAVEKYETKRLLLRRFGEGDIPDLFMLLKDEEVNSFLPWFPLKTIEEAKNFYQQHFADDKYGLAICLKEDCRPIGYIKVSMDESYDFGYALRKEFWHRGIVTEAGRRIVGQLKKDGVPYITATHDKNNPRSGGVMRQIGMKYCYSYVEQWQPKNVPVTFRMYQLNFDGQEGRVYQKYWNMHSTHFVEENI